MDQDLREYPFYKIVHNKTTHVFVGSKPEYEAMYQKSAQGKKGQGDKAKNIKMIQETIFNDDTVEVVRRKIMSATGLTQVYIWCATELHDQTKSTRAFLEDVFASRVIVSGAEIAHAYLCTTGHALDLRGATSLTFAEALRRVALPKRVLRTVGFSRQDGSGHHVFMPIDPKDSKDSKDSNDSKDSKDAKEKAKDQEKEAPQQFIVVDEGATTIETYRPLHHTLYVASDYIAAPKSIQQTYDNRQMESIRDYAPPATSSIACHPSYVQVRVQSGAFAEDRQPNLFKAFGLLSPTVQVPFIKWVSTAKTMFKMHKSYINQQKARATRDLTLWTRTNKFIKTAYEHVLLKVILDEAQTGTLVLEPDGSYHLRMKYPIGLDVDLATVSRDLLNVHQLCSRLLPLAPPNVKMLWAAVAAGAGDAQTALVKLTCRGTIKNTTNALTAAQITDRIDRASQLFSGKASVVKGQVDMLYKRFSGFAAEENIICFMNRFHTVKPAALVKLIAHVFSLDPAAAKAMHEEWESLYHSKQGEHGAYVVYKIVKMINLSVRAGKSAYDFQIDGLTSVTQARRIIHGLLYLLDGKVDAKKGVSASLVPNVDAGEDEEDDGNYDLDLDIDALFDAPPLPPSSPSPTSFPASPSPASPTSFQSSSSTSSSSPTNVQAMKQSMTCPGKKEKPKSSKSKANQDNKDADSKKESLLVHLKRADKDLFYVHKDKSNKQYVSTCQANADKHPVVMQAHEVEYNQKCFPGGIIDSANVGSTPELAARNFYTCPKVWCPKSRVALTMDQFRDNDERCPFPGVDETPVLFDKGQFKDRGRHIYLLDPTYHKDHHRSPCCGLKSMNQQKATRTRTAGWKYIVEHNVPVAQDRYSLLPAHLNSLFGNKYCGDKNGNNGLVNKNTDCYLIYGLPAQGQPLLQCLITSIENPDMQSQPDLVRLVHKHLDMTTFLTLADGLVCRAFLPNTNRIHDEALFVEFRKWFLGETSHEYRKRFQLESVWTQLFHMHSFTLSTQAPKDLATIYKKVLREFQLFSSYRGYLAYMSDASIIKNHDHVAPLLAAHWFNPKRFNLLIIQTSSIACPLYQTAAHAMDQEKPTVVLIHQGDYYYEPIHRIYNAQEGNKTNLVVDRVHPCDEPDNRASALIQTYIENCAASASASAFDPDAIRIRTLLDASAHAVKAQLLNFKFHVVAFYTKTNVIVPLKRPTPMDPAHASFFAFVDTCLKNFRHTVEERVVKGVFNAVNKIVPGYFAAAAVVKAPGAGGKHVALRLEAIDIIVPLVPYKQIKSSGAYQDIVKDGAIFSIYEKEDKRRNMVSMNRYVEILFQTLKNELVNVCNRVPALQKELAALKHPANPLPWEVKRTLLLDALQPYIKNLVHHSTAMPDVARIATGLEPICSNKGIKKPARCVHQCAKVVDVDWQTGKKTAAHCRLAVPKEHREYLVERCVEHLLNPVNPMEITPILTDHEVVDENIVVFSNADVAMQGIEAILAQLTSVGSSTFEKEYVAAAKLADVKSAPLPAFFQHMVDHDKPSFMESSPLKAFTLKKPTLPPSDWLYELFTVVNRRISAKAAVLSQENVRALVHKNIKSSWRADWQATLARLDNNPCFRRLLSAGQAPDAASPPTEKSALSIISDPAYQISTYEIEILAQLLGINVFITTRQTQRMPERMTCLGKQPAKDYYILLHQHQPARSAKDGIDEFYLYVKAGGKYLLTQADLGPTFGKCVRAKCTVGYDQKELEGVCPPYK